MVLLVTDFFRIVSSSLLAICIACSNIEEYADLDFFSVWRLVVPDPASKWKPFYQTFTVYKGKKSSLKGSAQMYAPFFAPISRFSEAGTTFSS